MNNSEIIVFPAFFATLAYIAWVLGNASQRRQRVKLLTEFHARLLDKLGSAKDFGEFMQTEGGARLMAGFAAEPAPAGGPQERILRAAQIGVVLFCLGGGLLVYVFLTPGVGGQGFTAIGTIALSLGVGFTVSAAASYRLAGMLGLLNRTPNPSTDIATTRA